MASRAKYKMTTFARFMLFLAFFIPIGYSIVHVAGSNDLINKPKEILTSLLKQKTSQDVDGLAEELQLLRVENEKLSEELSKCKGVVEEMSTTSGPTL